MKNIIYYSLVFIFSFVFTGCTKKITIKVRTYNKVTGESYPNSHIWIVKQTSTGNFKTIYDGYTDQNGELLISKVFFKTGHQLFSEPEGGAPNQCYINNYSVAIFKDGYDNKEINFEYAPCGYLSLSIHNNSCQGITDSITYTRNWLSGNYSGSGRTQIGCFNYDSDFVQIPMGDYQYEWVVVKNGITTYYDTTFYLDEGGVATVTMNY